MKYIFVLLICFSALFTNAQDRFHRNYPLQQDSATLQLGGIVLKDKTYLMVAGIRIKDSLTSLLFTNLSVKGNLNWSRKVTIDSSKSFRFSDQAFSIFQSNNGDSIYYAVTLQNASNKNKIIGALASNGIAGWTRQLGTTVNAIGNGQPINKIHYYRDTLMYNLANYSNDSTMYLSALHTKGSILNTWALKADGQSLVARDLGMSKKKTIGITGLTRGNTGYFIGVLDTLGRVRAGRNYTDTLARIKTIIPNDITGTLDSGFIVTGRYFNINAQDVANSFFGSFVAKHDSTGRLLWSKYINISDSFPIAVNNILSTKDNNYVVAGNYVDKTTGKAVPFMLGLSNAGNLLWARRYSRVSAPTDLTGSIDTLNDGSIAFFTSVYEGNDISKTQQSLIKVDKLGSSSCEDTIAAKILFDLPMRYDTMRLTSTSNSEVTARPIRVLSAPFAGYNITTLSLGVRPFCPNEPILWTFRAKTPGAVSYKWSTGATTDSIVVREEGMYTVEVKIDSAVCYTLCDTASLARLKVPAVELIAQNGNFCTNGLMTVRANYTPGADLTSYRWSNGGTNPSIEVASGNVSVTVTDACMETATASVNVVPPRLIQTVTATADFGNFCTTFIGDIRAVADAPVSRYSWSSGQTTQNIRVTQPGTYTVSVSDICNNIKTSTTTLTADNFPRIVTSLSNSLDVSEFCKTGNVDITSTIVGQYRTIQWSNNSTETKITVPGKDATYTVSVTDDCGVKTAETVVPDVDPVCLKIPKIFFPDSNNSQDSVTNRTFRVFSGGCPVNQIENFELRVFNRWGQEVWAATSLSDSWDGMQNGQALPPDVYVYFVRYRQNDCTLDKKGDITLLR